MRNFFCLVIILAASCLSSANESGEIATNATSSKSVVSKTRKLAVTINDTAVYRKPSFDSEVLLGLPQNKKIKIGRLKKVGLVEFVEINLISDEGKDITGWIVKSDLKIQASLSAEKNRRQNKKGRSKTRNGKRTAKEPFVFSRAAGLSVGRIFYKENAAGSERGASLTSYGIRITGADLFANGPLLDMNFNFHYGAPEFYSNLSSIAPTGFYFWFDTLVLMPLFVRDTLLVTLGFGPLLKMAQATATVSGRDYSMFEIDAGAVVAGSLGVRFDDWVVRFDGRYLLEAKSYTQVQLSLQSLF